jgi:hypothetical protein
LASPSTCGANKSPTGNTDGWKNTAATAENFVTTCCGDHGTCSAYATASTTAAASEAPHSQPTMIVGLCSLAMAVFGFA